MSFNNKKLNLNLKINHILWFVFIFILIFTFINLVSAAEVDETSITNDNTLIVTGIDDLSQYEKDVLSTESLYNIHSSATNDEIQSIIDNSKSGDTIQFNDNSYNNISIVVNKKLNIVSNKNSRIYTSDSISAKAQGMGIANTFGFYFTNLASGSTLKGLTIVGNADYDIIVEGGSSISIIGNTISHGKKAGILLNNSKYLTVKENIIKDNYDGIYLNNLNRSNFTNNRIFSNSHDGIFAEYAVLNNITSNRVYSNGLDGFHLENSKANSILKNKIIDNAVSGLRLEGYTTRNKIMGNNISLNCINIYANSYSTEDNITHNTIMFAKARDTVYVSEDNTGAAIVFGKKYGADKYAKMNYEYNTVGMNQCWDAKSAEVLRPPVEIGSNWYLDNDGAYGLGHICPLVFGGALTPDEFKHLSMGFGGDENGLFGQLYEGDKPAGAGAFTVDNVNVNGQDYGSFEVGEDGRLNLDGLDLDEFPAGSVIKITIGSNTFTVTLEDKVVSNKQKPSQDQDKVDLPVKEGASPSGTGNGTGSGFGSSTGSGSGEGNFTGSGISVGILSGQSNAGNGDSGENGGGSASKGISAYEITKEKNTPPTAKNSQLLGVFAVALVILIIALGYRSKNKDDYQLDNHNFEL